MFIINHTMKILLLILLLGIGLATSKYRVVNI